MAKVILDSGDTFVAASTVTILGSTGSETVKIQDGVTATVDTSVERIEFSGASSAYTFKSTPTGVQVMSGATVVANVANGNKLSFSDGSVTVAVGFSGGALTYSVGGATVTGTAAALTGATVNTAAAEKSTISSGTAAAGQAFALTNSATADSLILTTGSDTVTGASGTVEDGDLIIDQSSTDADVANLVLTRSYTPSNISKVETINLDWDAYTTPTYALAAVTGAKTVNLTSAKTGFLGAATVTGADGITLNAGAGMTGALTASGFKTGVVNATNSSAVTVQGSTTNSNNTSMTVNAGTAVTSVTVGTTNGFKSTTINAGTAATISIDDAGNTTDAIDLTVNANATITNTTDGAVSLTASNGNNITMGAIGASLTVKGTGDVVLNSTGLTGETVTNSKTAGTLTVKTTTAGSQDISKVQATTIEMSGLKTGADTVANGANLKYSGAAGAIEVTVTGTSTTDAVAAEITAATETSVTLTGVETLNLKANATAISGADLTIGTLATGGNKVVLTGTNDVTLTAVTGNGTVDATALVGDLVVSGTTASVAVKGGTGKLTMTSTGTTTDISAIGQSAVDTVTASTTTGSVTAILGDGANIVSATGLTTGTLVVTAGSGIDTVTSGAALTTGVINLSLGDGANVIGFADAGTDAGTRVVTTGSGDDTLTFTGSLAGSSTTNIDVLSWTAGTGTDTLVLATTGADLSSFTNVTLTGVEVIKVAAEDTTEAVGTTYEATFAASTLSGQNLTIKADAYDATKPTDIKVVGASTTTAINLANITLDGSITNAVSSATINASANTTTAVTITGTSSVDIITGGAKGDTIFAGNGADTIVGSAGNDSIDLTETTANSAADVVQFVASNGVDTITGFKVGTDDLSFAAASTTIGTTAGAAVADVFSAQLLSTAGAYVIGTGTGSKTTATADVVEITTTLSSFGNLALSTDGTELFKALGTSATTAATGLTSTSDAQFYLVAYQNGNAYVYYADADGDTNVATTEISLVGVVNTVDAGTLSAGDFAKY